MLSRMSSDDVHCVFVIDPLNTYNNKLCIAAFTSIHDAARFADLLGVRYIIEPYSKTSNVIHGIKVIKNNYYGN